MGILKKVGTLIIILTCLFIVFIFHAEIFQVLGPPFHKIFNEWIVWVYIGFIAYFCIGGLVYGGGYSHIKRNRVRGMLTTLFGALMIISSLIGVIFYTLLTVIFISLLLIEIKLILLVILLFASLPVTSLFFEKWFDVSTFFQDVWRQRKEYSKLTYTVEEKGKLIYINIEKNDSNISHVYEAAAILKIQDAFHNIRKNPDVSIALYIKSGLLGIVTAIVRNFTSWPRTKNRLYRRIARLKIGKNVCISHWTRLDPLFPDLIEFEEGSGVGVGCQLLTHNFMNQNPLTICIGPIKLEKNARVGAYSTIMPGVTIGEGSIVGAGSVVVDDIPPYCIAYGVPAQVVKKLEKNEN
ncbi:MAG: acyltransferase [Candidatus Helarchaeota archaeon]|nr:acyltransferase [Candidatus Helarchaeota archaeon]